GETYNVCTGKARLLKDYVRYLVRHAKVKLSVKVRRGRLRRGDPKRILGSPAKMRSLGWKSQGRVAEALVDTVASWRRSPRG
ncbi:MAG: hypothetical protein Q8R76_04820, partial [Candidatus Omnitrophota bacterium]|nr:hypothetical protein [Candidatus Omnitrophota bacterium]